MDEDLNHGTKRGVSSKMQGREGLVDLNKFQWNKHDVVRHSETFVSFLTQHLENLSETKCSFGLSILDISILSIGFASYIAVLLSQYMIGKKKLTFKTHSSSKKG